MPAPLIPVVKFSRNGLERQSITSTWHSTTSNWHSCTLESPVSQVIVDNGLFSIKDSLYHCMLCNIIRLTHLNCESFLFWLPILPCVSSAVCHLMSVCPVSHLGNYTRYARNFAVLVGNRGRRARI